jgi:uncharacterized protein (DUF885 family)
MQARNNMSASLASALRILDDAWQELQRSPFVQLRMGVAPTRLLDTSFSEMERRSKVGRSLFNRVESLDLDTLPHDLALTLRVVRFRARSWSRAADWYWNVVDPLGIGTFGMFLPTAYCGGFLLNLVSSQLASFTFTDVGDTDRYLALVADYSCLIDQFTDRTAGQAQRGILMPKVQVRQARSLLSAFKSGLGNSIRVAPQRLATLQAGRFTRDLDERIASSIDPAFERALSGLSDSYLARAPDSVGLRQYPGGGEIYADLVKLHTTLDISSEEVHERGHARMAEIEESMHVVRRELGFEGDAASFLAHLNRDPRWRAETVAGVTAVFERYISRLRPRLNEFFSMIPAAPYQVAPLPQALQGSMTFGYYDSPRRDRAEGIYLFNSANLTKQALFHIAALTYHELVPGHHLQLAAQQESCDLHPFRAHNFVTAYHEGWAEYAATFAGEIGMYEIPEERYGRLAMDAFLTSRLVVDTGMNVFNWSLEQARDYMREHSGMTEADILTETVRYSCDIPGQALAYKLGDTHILALRQQMRIALGAQFNLRSFHAAILGPGALPIPDLQWHLEHETTRLSNGGQS